MRARPRCQSRDMTAAQLIAENTRSPASVVSSTWLRPTGARSRMKDSKLSMPRRPVCGSRLSSGSGNGSHDRADAITVTIDRVLECQQRLVWDRFDKAGAEQWDRSAPGDHRDVVGHLNLAGVRGRGQQVNQRITRRATASSPFCQLSRMPSLALNSLVLSGGTRYARYRRPRPISPCTPAPASNYVVGMMKVSTNGRSTPLKTGGSWRSLMMPSGRNTMPARKFSGRDRRKST
jgi:hypothetical protein